MRKKLTRKLWTWVYNNDYTTGNLLDFAYFKENYRLIAIDLSKQTKFKSGSHVKENFCQIKILSSLVWKNTMICLFGV